MIIWFSGTGNSLYVARHLASALGDYMVKMTPDLLSGKSISHDSPERIIWVFPVYSWGIPPFVLKIIRNLNIKGIKSSTPHHLVLTCGDDTGLCAEKWRKELCERNWKAHSAFSVQMPNNYICMKGFDVDSPEVTHEKLEKAPLRISEITNKILQSEQTGITITDTVKGSFPWIKSQIIYPWFVHHAMSPIPFNHNNDCISCRKCATICPLDNITMAIQPGNDRPTPSWGHNCAFCLGCYHICPKHAVEYGNKTKNKGQYINPDFFVNQN